MHTSFNIHYGLSSNSVVHSSGRSLCTCTVSLTRVFDVLIRPPNCIFKCSA